MKFTSFSEMIMVDSSELISCRFVRYYQHEGAKSSYHTAYGVRYENVNAFYALSGYLQ